MLHGVIVVALGLIVYAHFLFPLIVFLRAALFPKPWKRSNIEPTVSFVIVCHNEVKHIAKKLDNLCKLDYAQEKISIIVASDGSNDGTELSVQEFIANKESEQRERGSSSLSITLLSLPRQGKIPALNEAVDFAKGEILVFSDANSQLPENALRNLVRNFGDSAVGCVAGNQVYSRDPSAGIAAGGEISYWDFDRLLKSAESRAGNAISATGAFYAIRRHLFSPVPAGVTDDFNISVSTILHGSRLVFEPDAIACEAVAGKAKSEYRRKVRVMTRGLRGVWVLRPLLNPLKFGFYSLQLLSHKVLRRLVALPLLVLLVLIPWQLQAGDWLQWLGFAQILFYGAALAGGLLASTRLRRIRLFHIPFYFCLVNVAVIHAVINLLRGRRIDVWDSGRGSINPAFSSSELSV